MTEKKKPGRPRKVVTIDAPSVEIQTPPEPQTQLQRSPNTYERICGLTGASHEKTRRQMKVSQNFKYIDGGEEIVYEYLRASEDEEVKKLLEVYDKVDVRDHDFLSFEEYCGAAGVNSIHIYEKLAGVMAMQSDLTSSILAASAHPQVLQATIEIAKTEKGHRERKILHTASGFLPRPKGSQTNVTFNNANVSTPGTPPGALPSFDQDIRGLSQRMQVSTELPVRDNKLLEGER